MASKVSVPAELIGLNPHADVAMIMNRLVRNLHCCVI